MILSGISGYAHKEAAICMCMATQCDCYWLPCLKSKDIIPSWATEYADFTNPAYLVVTQGNLERENEVSEDDVDLDGDEDDYEDEGELGGEDDLDSQSFL